MSEVVLSANAVKKSFFKSGEEISVLKGVNLNIDQGEMVAITGVSGTGKSTLLHILGTLEPPTSGEVRYGADQQNVFELGEQRLSKFRNRSLGFVFQFHYLLPEFSALENVMMPALIAGHARGPAEKQARELLKFVGLDHRISHRPPELSGGEQQRVAVARAVILRPQIILADEITGNLDSENTELVMDLLVQLNQATGVSVLMVTHDLGLANRMDRVLIMDDGRLIADEI